MPPLWPGWFQRTRPAADLEAVKPWHHHVQQHKIGTAPLHRVESLPPVIGRHKLAACPRLVSLQQLEIEGLVVDRKDQGHGRDARRRRDLRDRVAPS